MPLITVILPVYNVEDWLERCIDSLKVQTYTDAEFLIVDDGSASPCAALCDQLALSDPRIRVLHQNNRGVAGARNAGIQHARGRYITFVDPDDAVDPDYLEKLLNLLETSGTDMAVCTHRVVYENGDIKDYGSPGTEILDARQALERLLYHDGLDTSCWAKIYKKELFDGLEYPEGKLFEDMALTSRLILKSGKIALTHASRYTYYFHDHSIVNGSFTPAKLDLLEATDTAGQAILEAFPDLADAVERRRVYARFSTLNQMLNTGGYEEERRSLIRFIHEHERAVWRNPKTPARDRAAILLLRLGYPLYRAVWNRYRKKIMKNS